MPQTSQPLPAFAGVGLELEYAIVDRFTLDVRCEAARLLAGLADEPADPGTRGLLGWSNELVAHVVELKNVAPVLSLGALSAAFQDAVRGANAVAARDEAMLMPGGMHPWMDPRAETRLWPLDAAGVYASYHRIFDCRRHGWANVQSMHVNLPFCGDEEFARLHAAIRALLPLVPALAASSPFADGRAQPQLDHRLEVYRTHADSVPAIVGAMIPEPVASAAQYRARILEPLYRAIEPMDPHGTLRHEWLNARGAIARFDRSAIEIRLCDTQECPRVDVAIAAALVAVARALYDERWSTASDQEALDTQALARTLHGCMRDADAATLDDPAHRAVLGLRGGPMTAGAAWAVLLERCAADIATLDPQAAGPLTHIVAQGPLARRLRLAVGAGAERARLRRTYSRLCECLATGALFEAH